MKASIEIAKEKNEFAEPIGEVSPDGYFINMYKSKFYPPKSKIYLEPKEIPQDIKDYIEILESGMKRIVRGQTATSEFTEMLSTVDMAEVASKALASKPENIKE